MSAFFDRLNGVSSPRIGLGCMNLSHGYGQYVSETEALRVLEEAFEMGYRHFDTAMLYGGTANERLLGLAVKTKRHQLFLASKGGMALNAETGERIIDDRPDTLRRHCEESLSRLKTDYLDIYYLHRLDRRVPIEESVGALGRLVEEGKIGAVGLSEVSAETLRKGNAEYPVAAVQSEYSLWTRNPDIALKDVCAELGAALVAFSPLGRGFLTGAVEESTQFSAGDMRAGMPRFSKGNLPHNIALLDGVKIIARRLDISPAQLALAWLNAQGRHIVPIPGSCSVTHIRENLRAETVVLDGATTSQLNGMLLPSQVAGARYGDAQQADIDTEEFAD